MSTRGDMWYKREPVAFLAGIQGMGPELIGAYSVILDILYSRNGDMPRDDRHLAGVLGCSIRKARSLTDALIEAGKLSISGGKISNSRVERELFERKKKAETNAKRARSKHEIKGRSNKINGLGSANRIEENRVYRTSDLSTVGSNVVTTRDEGFCGPDLRVVGGDHDA